jgi:hypothetical protein
MHYVHAIDYLVYGYMQTANALEAIEAITYFARGLGAAKINNLVAAKENLKILDELYAKTIKTSPNYWALFVDAQKNQCWLG